MKQTIAFFLLALACILPLHAQMLSPDMSGQSPAPTHQALDRIVAVVNDDVILQSELDDAVASVKQQYASQPGQLPPENILEKQVLNRLVLLRLQVQKANDQGIHVSAAEVDQAVANVAKQNKVTTDQLQAEVQRSGASFAAFRKQLSDQILVQRLHESVVHSSVSVTDSEINNLLNSPTYKAGEVHLAHIQISIPGGSDAASIRTAQAKAEKALAAIKGGMDFHAAAIRYSDAPDALDGGDLGWRRMDELPAAFTDTIGSMKAGDVSAALRGPTGFHIIKLIGQRQPSRQMVTEIHARQILIKPTDLVSESQAEQKINSLYDQLSKKPKNFSELAKNNSDDDTTANIGGDMGWFQPDAWGTSVAKVLGQLQDQQISKPFKTEAGWDIVQRLGSRKSDLTDEIERNQARQAIGNRKSEQVFDDYLRDMRSNAYVRILVPALKSSDDQASGGASS